LTGEGVLELREALRLVSEENRYRIVLTLYASEKPLSFKQLQELTGLNPGSLRHHLLRLIDANLVENVKTGKNPRKPRSFYRLTKKCLELLEKIEVTKYEEEIKELFLKLAKPA